MNEFTKKLPVKPQIQPEENSDKIIPITQGESGHPYGVLIDFHPKQELTDLATGKVVFFHSWIEQPNNETVNPAFWATTEDGHQHTMTLDEIKKLMKCSQSIL